MFVAGRLFIGAIYDPIYQPAVLQQHHRDLGRRSRRGVDPGDWQQGHGLPGLRHRLRPCSTVLYIIGQRSGRDKHSLLRKGRAARQRFLTARFCPYDCSHYVCYVDFRSSFLQLYISYALLSVRKSAQLGPSLCPQAHASPPAGRSAIRQECHPEAADEPMRRADKKPAAAAQRWYSSVACNSCLFWPVDGFAEVGRVSTLVSLNTARMVQ